MNILHELVGQKVDAYVEYDDEEIVITGIVSDVFINDFYFEEKYEPIYITVNINPVGKLPKISDEELIELTDDIPLEKIRKS